MITGLTVGAVLATRPDLAYGARDLRPELVATLMPGVRRSPLFVVLGLAVALAFAFFVSPLASSEPDGLERVAIDQGFEEQAEPTRWPGARSPTTP